MNIDNIKSVAEHRGWTMDNAEMELFHFEKSLWDIDKDLEDELAQALSGLWFEYDNCDTLLFYGSVAAIEERKQECRDQFSVLGVNAGYLDASSYLKGGKK